MILPILLIFLCTTLVESLYDGDPCNMSNGSPGVCSQLKNCPVVFAQLMNGNSPDVLCGYAGFDPVVCCPTSAPTSTPLDTATRATPLSDGRGAISRQKCAEYAQYVYVLKYPPTLTNNRKPINVSQCAIKSQKLVVGGTKAERMEFPHMAAVGYRVNNDKIGWYCGGTLISEKFVLTAAHCTVSTDYGDAVKVRLGDLNLERTDDRASPIDLSITRRIRHPQYQPPSQYHDIALLRLERDVTFNGWIRPACLHTSPTTGTQNAIATGWGRVDWAEEEGSSDLRKVTLPIVNQATCNASYHASGSGDVKLINGVFGDLSICAGISGRDTCQGDSGGPLVIFSKKEYKCMYDVVGVTSLGRFCGSTIPGVYTRVYHYVEWIESTVWGRG